MKRFMVMLMVALFSVLLIAPDAEARRMGGGRSFGKQSDMIKRDAARPPAQAAKPANGAAAGAAPAGRSWMGPIAGLAAGLGLAALASHLGLGEEFGMIILMALLAFAVLVAVRMFMARRNAGAVGRGPRPAYAGGSAGGADSMLRQSPSGVGQPWAARASGSGPGTAAAGAALAPAADAQTVSAVRSSDVPEGFDTERFIHGAKVYFVRLQAAFDNNRPDDLREFTSPEMFAELSLDLMQRGDAKQTTDVVTLDARLLGVERTGMGNDTELASIRFEGMLRESSDAAAAPFVEIWNFTRPVDQSAGWVLAGIQQVD